MHKSILSLCAAVALFAAIALSPAMGRAAGFTLTGPTLRDGAPLPAHHVLNGFGCFGDNASPALNWRNPPQGTKSFAVTVYDPDAPTGSGWWHWVVFNIPSTATGLAEGAGNAGGALPAGAVQSRTDFGKPGFGGACPPEGHGDHRYIFTVYALDAATLDLAPDASAAMVGFTLNAHTLGKASLTAIYGR